MPTRLLPGTVLLMVALIVTAWLWPSGARPPVASAATIITVLPVADAWVDSSAPNTNFGTNNRLKVMAASKRFESFVRFSVNDVGPVSSARLRLFVADGSTNGGTVHQSIGPWSEGGVTWSNRPATGSHVGSLGAAVPKTWVEVDLTGVVTGDGTFDLMISGGVPDTAGYHSRESTATRRPQLVLTTIPTATPTPTPSGEAIADDERS